MNYVRCFLNYYEIYLYKTSLLTGAKFLLGSGAVNRGAAAIVRAEGDRQ